MYLRVERKDDTETRHKLAPIAEGPFPVKKFYKDNKTVLLERPDKTVENVSRSRVVLAPKGLSSEQLLEATRPMTIHEVIADFPAPEQDNLRHIRMYAPEDESNKAVTQNDEVEQNEPSEVPEEHMAASQQDKENQTSDTEEFTIEKVVNHKRNWSREHQYAKYGETLF